MPETEAGGRRIEDVEHSLGQLVAEATGDMSRLVRLELELAKLELAHDAKQVAKGSGMLVGAAVVGHLVLILASVTIGFGLVALGLSQWLSFLIVTVFYLLIALVLALLGRRQFQKLKGLPRTNQTVSSSLAVLRRGEQGSELDTTAPSA